MSLLIQLPDYLTWQSLLRYPEQIKVAYTQTRKQLFSFWLNSAKIPPYIKNDFNQLPSESRKRIFMAPVTLKLIMSSGLRPIARIRQMIRAEQYRTNNAFFDKRKKCWSPLGEQEFPIGRTSPYIHKGICLDAYSPWSKMELEGCQGKDSFHSYLEVKTIFNRLKEAFNLIGQTNESAAKCFFTVIQTIAIRKDITDPTGFGSSSWDDEPGKIGFTNAHLPHISIECFINALVHESIHSLLCMIEFEEPFYLKIEDKNILLLQSPWTGRFLRLHSFLHACFVWFALWNFWKFQINLQLLDDKQVNKFFEFAENGFLKGSLLEILEDAKSFINPDLLEVIRLIQTKVHLS